MPNPTLSIEAEFIAMFEQKSQSLQKYAESDNAKDYYIELQYSELSVMQRFFNYHLSVLNTLNDEYEWSSELFALIPREITEELALRAMEGLKIIKQYKEKI